MTPKDHIIAFFIMCVIDVLLITILTMCNVPLTSGSAFIIGIAVGIVVLYVYDEIKNG